jgi:hypothetical protein
VKSRRLRRGPRLAVIVILTALAATVIVRILRTVPHTAYATHLR